ncbi:unnamed protein product [Owenia fusiformis]|uniref:Uncharacterized protein n=1 Tax=Owenia fusiformis TaxID=6347 RepID=A0A8J1TBG7_OWEFU|nr:unnamed protein product [Owenia fusiformis]
MSRPNDPENLRDIISKLEKLSRKRVDVNPIRRRITKLQYDNQENACVACFQYPGIELTHAQVLRMVKQEIKRCNGRVKSIQFQDRNVIHSTGGLENRWIITLDNEACRDELVRRGLSFEHGLVVVRQYIQFLHQDERDSAFMQKLQAQRSSKQQ